MFGKTLTAGINGINTTMIEVEADVSQGLPGFEITGNMSAVGREARERVRIALKNVGIKLPPSKITINLSPANVYKSGTHYDLAIVVAILEAIGVLQREQTENYLFAGELSLDGGINPIRGALPLTIEAKNGGVNNIILPAANAKEGAVVGGINVIGVSNLQECMELLLGRRNITPTIADCDTGEAEYDDFVDIKGQRNLKRAIAFLPQFGQPVLSFLTNLSFIVAFHLYPHFEHFHAILIFFEQTLFGGNSFSS